MPASALSTAALARETTQITAHFLAGASQRRENPRMYANRLVMSMHLRLHGLQSLPTRHTSTAFADFAGFAASTALIKAFAAFTLSAASTAFEPS